MASILTRLKTLVAAGDPHLSGCSYQPCQFSFCRRCATRRRPFFRISGLLLALHGCLLVACYSCLCCAARDGRCPQTKARAHLALCCYHLLLDGQEWRYHRQHPADPLCLCVLDLAACCGPLSVGHRGPRGSRWSSLAAALRPGARSPVF